MLTLEEATTAEDMQEVISLFREYAGSLGFDLDFQDFEGELTSLPGEYSPPGGTILLARFDGAAAGCVALRRIDGETCEMKRLYVRPQRRGRGIGRRLAEKVIERARSLGYHAMRLDTVKTMVEANSLYHELGFREIGPYRYNPLDGASYKELRLD